MPTAIILNPKAGSVKGTSALVRRLRKRLDADVMVSTKKTPALSLAKNAVGLGYDSIVAAGGDGTLNEVINGTRGKSSICLGLIPLGTGNDFARTLGLPTDLDEAIEVIAHRRTRAIDLVRVTSNRVRYLGNVSAGGFSGLVDEKLTPAIKKSWGPLAYLRCALAALPLLHTYRTTVSLGKGRRLVT